MKIFIENAVFCDAESTFGGSMLLEDGKIAAIGKDISPPPGCEVIDAKGLVVMPGMVDSHVHLGEPCAFKMLLKAGVTSALDMGICQKPSGDPQGINFKFMYVLLPGKNLSCNDPGCRELDQCISRAIDLGARGIKIMGGHYPLTPAATKTCIELCAGRSFPCAVHVGTTDRRGDIAGLEQLLELRRDNPLHIAHVNSYCRGLVLGDPKAEALRALEMLENAENIFSESYLDIINGTSAEVDHEQKVVSLVTGIWLQRGGFAPTKAGIEQAISGNWALVNGYKGDEIVLLDPEEGRDYYASHPDALISFPVNCPVTAIMLAAAKNPDGEFIIDALSTDGGQIPRNTNLKRGLALVELGILSLGDFVRKSCYNPACYLGYERKGTLCVGSDADLIIIDQERKQLVCSIIGARVRYTQKTP